MSEKEPIEEPAAEGAQQDPDPATESAATEADAEASPPAAEPVTEVTEPAAEPEAVTEPLEPVAPAPTPPPRRLQLSRDDRVIAGVCGGLGEYLGVDAVLIRIAAIVLVFAGGAGLLLYAIGWIAMPEAPEPGTPEATRAAAAPARERTGGAVALGLAFVVLGAFFLADEIWSDFLAWKYIWPIALIAVGAVVLVRARR